MSLITGMLIVCLETVLTHTTFMVGTKLARLHISPISLHSASSVLIPSSVIVCLASKDWACQTERCHTLSNKTSLQEIRCIVQSQYSLTGTKFEQK